MDFEFGTGVLKVTPAHDKADFEIGQRHKLDIVEVIDAAGHVLLHDRGDTPDVIAVAVLHLAGVIRECHHVPVPVQDIPVARGSASLRCAYEFKW